MKNDADESARLDARLNAALRRLPDAPLPSNFTARVLAAVELEEKLSARSGWHWHWRSLFPRVAVAAAVLIFAGVSIQRYEAGARRLELTKSVAMVAASPGQPGVEALENLDAIRGMSQSARADGDLLAVLQ